MKKGILIVSFGTTHKETREKNIERLVQEVRDHYPGYTVSQAYSSNKIRSILESRDGIRIPGIGDALEEMRAEGVEHVIVMPTHIIDGIENTRMKRIVEDNRAFFQTVKISGALLEHENDYSYVAAALWDSLKESAEGRILVLMGHGTEHQADESYVIMEKSLREYSGQEIYIATVEGAGTIENVMERIRKNNRGMTRILLAPFMLVAGDHAVCDMAGKEDSFVSKLSKEGFETECILKGLGEYENIRKVYLEHLKNVC